jgi:Flp pilus assembly pilin Flp
MLAYALTVWAMAVDRARQARSDDEGASALEWAIIAAILVVAATTIGAIIYRIVQDKGATLEQCANQPVGSSC